jgi:hypothetical protein
VAVCNVGLKNDLQSPPGSFGGRIVALGHSETLRGWRRLLVAENVPQRRSHVAILLAIDKNRNVKLLK